MMEAVEYSRLARETRPVSVIRAPWTDEALRRAERALDSDHA